MSKKDDEPLFDWPYVHNNIRGTIPTLFAKVLTKHCNGTIVIESWDVLNFTKGRITLDTADFLATYTKL